MLGRRMLLLLGTTGLAAIVVAAVLWPKAGPIEASQFTSLATGYGYTCSVTTTGGVKCWGWNGEGKLGDGTTTLTQTTPVDVSGLGSGVATVSGGGEHTCALTVAGGIKCWGWNGSGELGDGTTENRTTPVDVSGLVSGVAVVSAGGTHTCAVTIAGGLKCWGGNGSGELGDGTTEKRTVPVDVSGLSSGITDVSAGNIHTCALTTTGGLKCWGLNLDGQLGDGTTENRTAPVDVAGLSSGVTNVSSGLFHTCAVTTAGGVKCWGDNYFGQLGDGTSTDRASPVDVVGLGSGVVAVAAAWLHTCVLTTDGSVKCWGLNGSDGLLGDGMNCGWICDTPVEVMGLASGIVAISAGSSHTCVLTDEGEVKCWGVNVNGQLGDGTTTSHASPVEGANLKGTPIHQVGDANCDGVVDPLDAALILQLGAGLIAELPCPGGGDPSGDGVTNPLDAALILQFSAGLISSLPP